MTTPWQPLADRLLATLRSELGDDLVATWVHGSAALGGFVPGCSDLDVLVVVDDDAERNWRAVGSTLAAVDGERMPLELSVIRRGLAERPCEPWPFAVHVTVDGGRRHETKVLLDEGRGDADLLLHLAVTRAAGLTLAGPPPGELVGEVDRDDVVAQLMDELRWGVDNADETYAVLNACRALRYAETSDLVSKVAGGRWGLERLPEHTAVITRALDAHERGTAQEGAGMAGRALVQDVLDEMVWA